MNMKIEVEATQIAAAILGQDYPDQALVFNALGKVMKSEAENEDKYYRWTRYIIAQVDLDGLQFFRDMSRALKDRDDEMAALEKKT